MARPMMPSPVSAAPNASHHPSGVFFSVCTETISVTSWNERLPRTSGASASVFGVPSAKAGAPSPPERP